MPFLLSILCFMQWTYVRFTDSTHSCTKTQDTTCLWYLSKSRLRVKASDTEVEFTKYLIYLVNRSSVCFQCLFVFFIDGWEHCARLQVSAGPIRSERSGLEWSEEATCQVLTTCSRQVNSTNPSCDKTKLFKCWLSILCAWSHRKAFLHTLTDFCPMNGRVSWVTCFF